MEIFLGILWLKKQYFKDPNDTHRKKKSEDSATLNNFIRNLKSPELADLTDTKPISSLNKSLSDLQTTGHIMISYNKECRDLCLKIKKDLENDGHKIWIDVEDISGSSLESKNEFLKSLTL